MSNPLITSNRKQNNFIYFLFDYKWYVEDSEYFHICIPIRLMMNQETSSFPTVRKKVKIYSIYSVFIKSGCLAVNQQKS